MTPAITHFSRAWSALALLLLPVALLAQTNTLPTSSSKTTAMMVNGGHPDNPTDQLIGDPMSLSQSLTTVDNDGNVVNTVVSSCPKLLVDVTIPFIQSCVASTAVMTFCNHGGNAAHNAYVEVAIDSNLQLDSASIAYVPLSAHHYRFDVGTISTGDCGHINLHVTTACDPSLLGKTHCIDAHIYPDTLCTAIQHTSLLEVNGQCLGNAIKFRMLNHGTAMTASQQVEYIIIDDHLIANGSNLVLARGFVQLSRHGVFSKVLAITPQSNHMNYRMEVRDVQNTVLAICFIEVCSPTTSHSATVSNFYPHVFWNGSGLPFTDRGCGINGKVVVTASAGNNSLYPKATDSENGSDDDNAAEAAIEDLHLQTLVEVVVSPNPVIDQAMITLSGSEKVRYQFELYSITGQLVRTLAINGNSSQHLTRDALPAGLYVYRISAKGVPLQDGKIVLR